MKAKHVLVDHLGSVCGEKNVRYEKTGKEGIKRLIGEGVGGQEVDANVYVCRLMTECGVWRK